MTVAAEKFSSSDEIKVSSAEFLHPFEGESVAGFFLRLAEISGGPGPASAAKRLGVTLNELRWGPRQRRGNSARIAGHQIPIDLLDLDVRRICPGCLAEGHFVREWWEISIFSACPIHGISLQANCSCGKKLSWDDGYIDRCQECYGLAGREGPLPQQMISPLEDLIGRRLGIVKGAPLAGWLQASSVSFLLRLFEKVGVLIESGYLVSPPPIETDAVGKVGNMEKGLKALQSDLFETIVARSITEYRDRNDTDFPKRPLDGLGWFGDWIGDEQLPDDHPFISRLKVVMEAALGCQIVDLHCTGVMQVSVLADRLKVTTDTAIDLACRELRLDRLRGVYVPAAIAAEVEQHRL